ncbi:MAG: hypothetical protein ACE3JK_17540 [Sporolactobacillus sp.]
MSYRDDESSIIAAVDSHFAKKTRVTKKSLSFKKKSHWQKWFALIKYRIVFFKDGRPHRSNTSCQEEANGAKEDRSTASTESKKNSGKIFT